MSRIACDRFGYSRQKRLGLGQSRFLPQAVGAVAARKADASSDQRKDRDDPSDSSQLDARGRRYSLSSVRGCASWQRLLATRETQPRAQAALVASPFYELRKLVVEHCGEVLVLSGVVSSFYHKQVAQEVVRSVCQDQDIEVDNRIRVQ